MKVKIQHEGLIIGEFRTFKLKNKFPCKSIKSSKMDQKIKFNKLKNNMKIRAKNSNKMRFKKKKKKKKKPQKKESQWLKKLQDDLFQQNQLSQLEHLDQTQGFENDSEIHKLQ